MKTSGVLVKTGLIVGLSVAAVSGAVTPSFARDGGAIAAGVIGGTALGLLAGSAAAGAYAPPPPPPAYYAPAAPAYYAPPPPPPRRCHWDGYAGVYVDHYGRVCD